MTLSFRFINVSFHLFAVDPCFLNPCLNEGTCTTFPDSIINGTALFNCTCHSEFFGETCEIGK